MSKLTPNSNKVLFAMQQVKDSMPILEYDDLVRLSQVNKSNINKNITELISFNLVSKTMMGKKASIQLTEIGKTFNIKQDILQNGSVDKDIIKSLFKLMREKKLDFPKELLQNDVIMNRIVEIMEEIKNEQQRESKKD